MLRLRRINTQDGNLYGYAFVCPGCEAFLNAKYPDRAKSPPGADMVADHVIPTTGDKAWGFNGDVERPTFTPSILIYEYPMKDGTVYQPRCHSFVRDGRIEFLSDCGHPLAGTTVDLPEASDA